MRRYGSIAGVATVAILATLPVTLSAWSPAAQASTSQRSQFVVCGTLKSVSQVTWPATLGDCNHPRITGGSGTITEETAVTSPNLFITWANGKKLGMNAETNTQQFPTRCSDNFQLDLTDKVVTVSRLDPRRFINSNVAWDVCLSGQSLQQTLAPGTSFTIGPLNR
jgi:hypothetical protein